MTEVAEYLAGDTIECLECGKHYRMLTGKHLRLVHGLTPDEYRKRWGLPYTTPLAGQATRRARSEVAQQMIADGRLTYDHLPRAAEAAQSVSREKSPIARRAQSDLARTLRPGDHSKLPPGALRANGKPAVDERFAQRKRRSAIGGGAAVLSTGKFSAEEDEFIQRHHNKPASWIARRINRLTGSVGNRALALGLSLPLEKPRYSADEDAFILQHLHMPPSWLARELGRSTTSVWVRAVNGLGVKPALERSEFTADEDDYIRQNASIPAAHIARALGRSQAAVTWRATRVLGVNLPSVREWRAAHGPDQRPDRTPS